MAYHKVGPRMYVTARKPDRSFGIAFFPVRKLEFKENGKVTLHGNWGLDRSRTQVTLDPKHGPIEADIVEYGWYD